MKKLIFISTLLLLWACSESEDMATESLVKTPTTDNTQIVATQNLHIPTWLQGKYTGSNNGTYLIKGDNLVITDKSLVRTLTRVTGYTDGSTFTDYYDEFNMTYFTYMSKFKEEYGVSNGFRYYKVFAFDSIDKDYGLRLYIEEKGANRIYWWATEYRHFIRQ